MTDFEQGGREVSLEELRGAGDRIESDQPGVAGPRDRMSGVSLWGLCLGVIKKLRLCWSRVKS